MCSRCYPKTNFLLFDSATQRFLFLHTVLCNFKKMYVYINKYVQKSYRCMQMSLHLHILNFLVLSSFTGRNSNARSMGKKGSWFSAIKRVFSPHSKEKLANVS
jgi:hypothetical protein